MAIEKKVEFDPDYSPNNPVNSEAAKHLGLRYDSRLRVYIDKDGCLIRDKFGQEF